jgi:23S rRNA (cytidine1920-2'-O)/16S rRNA (cytidine1409-2'-O)-methyltransferase
MNQPQSQYVSRGGEKLAAALDAFDIDPTGWVCADFGSNVGGFTDCLLQRGAAKVYAIDTGYGDLAWTLRKDDRVVVMERVNALHCEVAEPVDLVVADMAWTPQRHLIPAAAGWLKTSGCIVSLLKCHYERAKIPGGRKGRKPPPLTDEEAEAVRQTVCDELTAEGFDVCEVTTSPLRGKGGNVEYLILVRPRR